MHLLLFLQRGDFPILPVQILWGAIIVLFVITLFLFVASIAARTRHWSHEKLTESLEEKFYPIILSFLDGDLSEQEVQKSFTGRRVEYEVFEKIVFEMLENVRGTDAEKIRKLLYLTPIFNYHLKQLSSSNTPTLIKSCNYFSYIRLVNTEIIEKLISFLSSGHSMLAFSAASALMSSEDVEVRAKALKIIATRPRFSRMALLEMVYKFHRERGEQMAEESIKLKELITNPRVPLKNLGILIEGASELGYQNLLPLFTEKLQSPRSRWRNKDVLESLIKTQGDYYNVEASAMVAGNTGHAAPQVRRAVVETLGKIGGEENLDVLYEMLDDKDFEVRYLAVKALYENGQYGKALLEKSYDKEHLNTKTLLSTIVE